MNTCFVEVTQSVETGFNHGKFLVGLFTAEEWAHRCEMDAQLGNDRSLLFRCGWRDTHALVLDLQTGEGAIFSPGGSASADLDKHAVWVCPMFEPFLAWLYEHVRATHASHWFDALPELVELPNAPSALQGYRRSGPSARERASAVENNPQPC